MMQGVNRLVMTITKTLMDGGGKRLRNMVNTLANALETGHILNIIIILTIVFEHHPFTIKDVALEQVKLCAHPCAPRFPRSPEAIV